MYGSFTDRGARSQTKSSQREPPSSENGKSVFSGDLGRKIPYFSS
jgi:hypothetical protein